MSGSAIANHARSFHGNPSSSTECSRNTTRNAPGTAFQSNQREVAESLPKMGDLVDLRPFRHRGRFTVPLCPEVAIKNRPRWLRTAFAGAVVLVAVFCAPCMAADATDVTIRTGPQLRERIDREWKTEDGHAAIQYFLERGNKVSVENVSEIQFRSDGKDHSLLFIPFGTTAASKEGSQEHSFILSTEGPKGPQVFLGTVVTQPKERPEVKDEKVVVRGKVESDKGQLRNFIKCTAKDCLTASLTCLMGGPEWFPCFCLACGAGAVTCGLTEIFYPN